jgi:single-strand DNA-binding protein
MEAREMNDSQITLQGWLGGDVRLHQAGAAQVAQFRVASTPRRFSRTSESWSDGETQWYTVKAWRGLADHCHRSLRRGDPVVVHGRLEVRRWVNAAGVEVTDLEVDAAFVGHDLNRGVSSFTKTVRMVPVGRTAEEAEPSGPDETDDTRRPPAGGVEEVVGVPA